MCYNILTGYSGERVPMPAWRRSTLRLPFSADVGTVVYQRPRVRVPLNYANDHGCRYGLHFYAMCF